MGIIALQGGEDVNLDLIADRNYWKQEAADNLRMAEEQHAQAAQG